MGNKLLNINEIGTFYPTLTGRGIDNYAALTSTTSTIGNMLSSSTMTEAPYVDILTTPVGTFFRLPLTYYDNSIRVFTSTTYQSVSHLVTLENAYQQIQAKFNFERIVGLYADGLFAFLYNDNILYSAEYFLICGKYYLRNVGYRYAFALIYGITLEFII